MLFMVYPHMVPSKGPPAPGPGGAGGPVGHVGGASGLPGYLGHGPTGIGSISTAAAAIKSEVYDPKLFGFRVNESAKLKRWREAMRDE